MSPNAPSDASPNGPSHSSADRPAAPDLRTADASPFALWLTLRGRAGELWRATIEALASELGGPVFTPHVTLWGRFSCSLAEAQKRVEVLTRDLSPIPLRGAGIGMRQEAFRALFVPVATTSALWRAHLAAHDALAPGKAIEYQPHLSLYYGERPSARKLAALSRLDPLPPIDTVADSVTLVSIAGPPESWSVEAILPLRG